MMHFVQRCAVKIGNVRDASRQVMQRLYHLWVDDGYKAKPASSNWNLSSILQESRSMAASARYSLAHEHSERHCKRLDKILSPCFIRAAQQDDDIEIFAKK